MLERAGLTWMEGLTLSLAQEGPDTVPVKGILAEWRGMPSVAQTLSSRAPVVWTQLIPHPVALPHTRAQGQAFIILAQPWIKPTCT